MIVKQTLHSAAKMNSRCNFSESLQNLQSSLAVSSLRAAEVSVFRSIPPERVGLQGEYDYNGLAKRVSLSIQQQFDESATQFVRVLQRGAVVVLESKKGKVAYTHLVQMANIGNNGWRSGWSGGPNGNTVISPLR